jgi:hypothetical protein
MPCNFNKFLLGKPPNPFATHTPNLPTPKPSIPGPRPTAPQSNLPASSNIFKAQTFNILKAQTLNTLFLHPPTAVQPAGVVQHPQGRRAAAGRRRRRRHRVHGRGRGAPRCAANCCWGWGRALRARGRAVWLRACARVLVSSASCAHPEWWPPTQTVCAPVVPLCAQSESRLEARCLGRCSCEGCVSLPGTTSAASQCALSLWFCQYQGARHAAATDRCECCNPTRWLPLITLPCASRVGAPALLLPSSLLCMFPLGSPAEPSPHLTKGAWCLFHSSPLSPQPLPPHRTRQASSTTRRSPPPRAPSRVRLETPRRPAGGALRGGPPRPSSGSGRSCAAPGSRLSWVAPTRRATVPPYDTPIHS